MSPFEAVKKVMGQVRLSPIMSLIQIRSPNEDINMTAAIISISINLRGYNLIIGVQ